MMSKNSFWVNLKENNKRRIWVWILSGLLWLFYYPVGISLLLSRKKNHNLIDHLTGSAAKERLVEAAGDWLSVNALMAVLVTVFAIICAIQGFSYLYSREKVDMYHSVPVKKSRRFAVIYINGFVIYLVTYTASLLLAVLIAALNGGMSRANIGTAVIAWGMNFVLFAGTYAIAALAVMLTGNLLISLFASAILLLYEMLVRILNYYYQSAFYDYFYYNSVEVAPFLSPIGQYARVYSDRYGKNPDVWAGAAGMGLLLAVLFTAAAYWCYIKRPSEAAGKTMAFARMKAVVKLLLTVPVTLGIVYIVGEIVGSGKNSTLPIIFVMVLTTVLSNCVIEVIYEMDLKAAFGKKYQILISGGCAAVIYCIFCFDLTGFDEWVPEPEQLEDAMIVCTEDRIYNHVDETLNYVDPMDYCMDKPGITDVEAVCELSRNKSEDGDLWLVAAYRMKNGKTVWREFPVNRDPIQALNRIVGSREYKSCVYQIMDEDIYQAIKNHKIKELTYETGFCVENLKIGDLDAFRSAYLKDLELADYTTYSEEYCLGLICLEVEAAHGNRYFGYPVYPSYKHTLAFLQERNIDAEGGLKAEEIAGITVTNYHNELLEQTYKEGSVWEQEGMEMAEGVTPEDAVVHKTFTDEAQIQELIQALYSTQLPKSWKEPDAISNNYYVSVQYKEDAMTNDKYRGNNEAWLITDRIPAWLEAATAYK